MKFAFATSVLIVGLGTVAHAESYGKPCTSEPESKWLSLKAIEKVVTDHGYTVAKSKRKGTCVEVYARDSKGGKFELFIDPATGNPVGTTWDESKGKQS